MYAVGFEKIAESMLLASKNQTGCVLLAGFKKKRRMYPSAQKKIHGMCAVGFEKENRNEQDLCRWLRKEMQDVCCWLQKKSTGCMPLAPKKSTGFMLLDSKKKCRMHAVGLEKKAQHACRWLEKENTQDVCCWLRGRHTILWLRCSSPGVGSSPQTILWLRCSSARCQFYPFLWLRCSSARCQF